MSGQEGQLGGTQPIPPGKLQHQKLSPFILSCEGPTTGGLGVLLELRATFPYKLLVPQFLSDIGQYFMLKHYDMSWHCLQL